MGSVNKVILVGNLGRDAELRYTPGGAAIAKFSIATTEVWNDKSGQRQERTEWHNVDLWGKQAESLKEYLTKGKQVFVEGRLQSRKAPRCRNCDAFLPERDWRPGDRDQKLRCQKCDHETVPYIQADDGRAGGSHHAARRRRRTRRDHGPRRRRHEPPGSGSDGSVRAADRRRHTVLRLTCRHS